MTISTAKAVTGDGLAALVVSLPAEIDMVNAEAVRMRLCEVVPGVTMVIADLTGTTFCAVAGLHSITSAHRHAADQNAELRLATRSPSVLRVIELTGLFDLTSVYPSVEAALQAEPAPEAPGSSRPCSR